VVASSVKAVAVSLPVAAEATLRPRAVAAKPRLLKRFLDVHDPLRPSSNVDIHLLAFGG
jgi:hypothetical protein